MPYWNLSPIYFDPTGTLLSRSSIPSFERLCLTGVEGESVGIWVHRFSPLFRQFRRVRRLVAVDEAVLKVSGQTCYLWAAIDVDTNEVLAVYASRGIPSAIKFLRKILDSCECKPLILE
ncbi:MAG: DDE-type integrase/transposase/recombinase [Candidatus Caldarchaeales archaeon]|nr:DDE-type integrase/transposase/recombinase [Candidatus Caldarchaeales archaeon]